MTDPRLEPGLSREQILDQVTAAERRTLDLLRRAADLAHDPEGRRLYERLAGRVDQSLRELQDEAERLDAEQFVQHALDV